MYMLPGYEPPRRQSTGLFGLVKSSKQSLVDCPLGDPAVSITREEEIYYGDQDKQGLIEPP